MKFSDKLLEEIRERKAGFPFSLERRGIVRNLEFLYNACVASEGLLEDAGKLAEGRLADYYRSHLEEEKDEIGVLREDLLSAGIDPFVPDDLAMGMVGTQYYLIKHVHPVCLLGYMAVQEADPTPIALVEHLEELYGKPLFRFIRMHAIKDLEHRKELIELIDSVSEQECGMIWFSADNTLRYLARATNDFYKSDDGSESFALDQTKTTERK